MNNLKTKRFKRRFRGNGFSNSNYNNKRRRPFRTKTKSVIDPQELIQIAAAKSLMTFKPSVAFEDMPLDPRLISNLAALGFTHPTQIQQDSFNELLNGRDIIGVANTGTGKTAAFLLPIIQQLLQGKTNFTTIVVVPTRELALQVEQEFKNLTRGLGMYSASFIGGTSVSRDVNVLRKNHHLIIGTPGRLIDLANRGALQLSKISVLVLDEFDRMLDMGFVDDIKRLVSEMKNRKQTMLFSATIDKTQKSMIDKLLVHPLEVKVSQGAHSSSQIDQDIIKIPAGEDKFQILLNMMDNFEFEKVLIFAETKRLVDKVSKRLNQSGVRATLIHGDKSQNFRIKALEKFKKGKVKVLVATDVAARGIDVSDISHVVNYQLPLTFDSYVHRIGRTGRAGKKGRALTFVD